MTCIHFSSFKRYRYSTLTVVTPWKPTQVQYHNCRSVKIRAGSCHCPTFHNDYNHQESRAQGKVNTAYIALLMLWINLIISLPRLNLLSENYYCKVLILTNLPFYVLSFSSPFETPHIKGLYKKLTFLQMQPLDLRISIVSPIMKIWPLRQFISHVRAIYTYLISHLYYSFAKKLLIRLLIKLILFTI